MPIARVSLDDYSNKILNIVKAKYDLTDKSEAINKFLHMYGKEEFHENDDLDASDNYVKKVLEIEKNHIKQNGFKKMNKSEFDELFK
ncbi:MAG: DUF2683 family protein [Candidatus ainarchaeum sp.]|nr:DUF2683 family protein [Candidatus ainarchaeum sp.]